MGIIRHHSPQAGGGPSAAAPPTAAVSKKDKKSSASLSTLNSDPPPEPQPGSAVVARVLDVSKREGIVDLSDREDLIKAAPLAEKDTAKVPTKGKKGKAGAPTPSALQVCAAALCALS